MELNLSETEKMVFEHTIELLQFKLTKEQIQYALENIYEMGIAKGKCSGIDESLKTLKSLK